MAFSKYVRDFLPLKIIIKEVIGNLVIDSEKLDFLSRYTVYEENNSAIVVTTSPNMNPTSNHISDNYHWFTQNV